jgi:uncharacterized membrane protein
MATMKVMDRALGVFSAALGAVQLAAPRAFSEWVGVPANETREKVVRAVGIREIGAALGLLTSDRPRPWVWSRVAGDLMDLALLGRALTVHGARRDRVRAMIATVLGITAIDLVVALRSPGPGPEAEREAEEAAAADPHARHGKTVRKAITVDRPREDVYAYWRDLQNLARFMANIEEVRQVDERRSHWKARAPLGGRVEWDAEIVEDRPYELLAWRSIEGADVDNSGKVWFRNAPGDRGTEVQVEMHYVPPAGPIGVAVAKVLGMEPEQQTADDLRRFKQVLETGEVVLSEAVIEGRRIRQRPAQPVEEGHIKRPAELVGAHQ